MLKRLFLLLGVLAAGLTVQGKESACPMVHIVPERLPNLTMPRSGHSIFYANGELTLVGGHTTHFVPTPTAEYFADGVWHQIPMAYSHDNGFAIVLRSGEVIIGGGHDEPLGVGQTFMLERYNPPAHSFEGFGCLDRRRVLANAAQLADGQVIIAGNHYADDAIANYDGRSQVQHIKSVTQGRSNPYILPIADDNAVILGANDQYDKHPDTVWVDRLKGDAFRVPLLEQWRLIYTDQPFSSDACAVGNLSSLIPSDSMNLASRNTYLLTATDKSGQLAIVMMRDTVFSLLPTACPIPMESPFGPVFYKGPVVVDSLRHRGYVMGIDSMYFRQYVLAIDYAQQPAALTLYYTDSLEQATITIPIVTPDGDLILAGGHPNTNYKPLAEVWLYRFATTPQTAATGWTPWVWTLPAILISAMLAYLFIYLRRRRKQTALSISTPEPLNDQTTNPLNDQTTNPLNDQTTKRPNDQSVAELMERISQLMDEERLYLHSDLKLQDVAVRLNTNSGYVSECINTMRGLSFSQFVNTYRVSQAQELLRQQPDLKAANVATASGFSTESSFFRNFKLITGMTPREWLGSL